MTAGPIETESRIELVDALRGFALAGVLFINLRLFSQFDFLNGDQWAALGLTTGDDILLEFAQVFGDGKFISLFSMLFGYGFSLQIARLEARAGLLTNPADHRSLLRWVSVAGVVVGVLATLVIAAIDGTSRSWLMEDQPGWNLFIDLNALGFSIAYACWFALLFIRPRGHSVLRHLAPVGRMCLTNYLTQTIVCVVVFYGVGVGVGPRFGMRGVYLAWAILFGAQMILSPIWLSRFRFGPAEWVWRSMTYGRIS